MKKRLKASLAIEAAVIIPMVLLMFAGMISVLFYYHDKIIITGAAYEIAAVGSAEDEITREELAEQFEERVDNKLLLFRKIHMSIQIEETDMTIQCKAVQNSMVLEVEVCMCRTAPEKYIRNIRSIEKLKNQIGDSE